MFYGGDNYSDAGGYKKQREHLLRHSTWNLLVRLGAGAFETISGEVVNAILLTLSQFQVPDGHQLIALDVSACSSAEEKALALRRDVLTAVGQSTQLDNPGSVIVLGNDVSPNKLGDFAIVQGGTTTGDAALFRRQFWEVDQSSGAWAPQQGTVSGTELYAGHELVLLWEGGRGQIAARTGGGGATVAGRDCWKKHGIAIAKTGSLYVTLYTGEVFENVAFVLIPKDPVHLAALWSFCSSPEFHEAVRSVNQAWCVDPGYYEMAPIDLAYWQAVARDQFPGGLPKPLSNAPTQWIFHGHPLPATDPLQVAVARLLGYRWPAERDEKMELGDDARAWVSRCAELDPLCDDDGIVCLPAVRGEAVAVDRLRALLARAFGADWSASREAALLREAGCDGLPLAQWLRDKFFAQHVARFQKRPFIWHVWDGHKEGFSALVNVHTLTRAKLQTLIHTYLGDWITQQKRAVDAGDGDATLRLARAKGLNDKLEAILEGEEPYDIFVRWKPAHLQPIGWEPDLNDGVRMNIRPFVQAEVLRIPGRQLGIKWEPDRGKDVPSAPWFKLGPTYGEPEGTRINDHHLSLADKQAARAKVSGGKKS